MKFDEATGVAETAPVANPALVHVVLPFKAVIAAAVVVELLYGPPKPELVGIEAEIGAEAEAVAMTGAEEESEAILIV